MKLLLSVPSGYHARELLTPLKSLLSSDPGISAVFVLVPIPADRLDQTFSGYANKFMFFSYPGSPAGFDALLSRLKPDLAVTDTNGLDEHDPAIINSALRLNIPSVTFIASWDNIWKIAKWMQKNRQPATPGRFIVWNRMMKDHLHRLYPSYTDDAITIIGPPRFDFFTHADKIPTRAQLFEYLGFPDPSRLLIHFATTELYPMGYIVKAIHNASRRGHIPAKINLFASVHPGGRIEAHRYLQEKYDTLVRYSFGRRESAPVPEFLYHPTLEEIYFHIALFKHADLLINHSSTVALESFAADTPVINVKYGQPYDLIKWRRSVIYRDFREHYQDILADKPTRVVLNAKQLVQSSASYLENPALDRENRRRNLQKMISITDGTAGRHFLSYLKQIAP